MRDRLKLLLIGFISAISSAAAADVKAAFPSYIGEYAERQTGKFHQKVDFPRCRQINSYVVVSQSGEWYILSECDIDQPKIRSIRIWRAKLEAGVGLKIHGEIILPWQKLHLFSEYPYMCNRKGKQEFSFVGYIGLSKGKVSMRSGLAYVLSKDDGTIVQVPYTEIDSCDLGESGTLTQSGIR